MKDVRRENRNGHAAGFSLIELMVVVAIIMLLAAMSLPGIGRYFRQYKIRGAQEQVAGAIQQTRNRAISKNVNLGVSFVVQDQTRYWVHIEDDQSPAHSRTPQTLTFASPNLAQSTQGTLPEGVRFASSATECPSSVLTTVNLTGSYAPNAGFFRFNRLGGWCGVSCAALSSSPAPASLLMNNASGTFICLFQPATGLSLGMVVTPGGRVQSQR